MTQSEFNAMLENALDFYNSRHSGSQIDQGVTGGLGAVRFDTAQTLAEMQKAQARSNLGIRADGATGAVDSVNGKTGTVVLNGDDIYANSQNTETIGEALGNIHYVNPNLLDNWYFGNPVNQRGQTSYNSGNYTIDRWTRTANTAISLNSENVGFKSLGGDAWFTQPLNLTPDKNSGEQVTVSVLTTEGNLNSKTGVLGTSGRFAETGNINGLNTYVGISGDRYQFALYTSSTNEIGIRAVKLELGSVQTLARQVNGEWVLNEIPDYGEQLARCQRYQLALNGLARYRTITMTANTIDFFISTPVPMRLRPAISNFGNPTIFEFNSGVGYSSFTWSVIALSENGVYIRATKENHGLTDARTNLNLGTLFECNL